MPRKARYLVLADFTWCPKRNVVMVFKAGEIREGLTRQCLTIAGDRVMKITS